MSRVVGRLVALSLVCVYCFIFYNFGSRVGSIENWKPLLRLGGDKRNANRPNLTDFDLESIDDIIPHCARDVFVTLHKEGGGEGEHACRGLIIRDDIIVTSRECSTFDFTFDFAGVGNVEANPHPALNEGKVTSKSSLGFLEAHPPYHFHWIDQPVRRTRLFLSKNSNPRVNGTGVNETGVNGTGVNKTGVNGTRVPTAILTCGEGGEPIAHNFPAHGEMVPLLELEGVVPDGILWEDKDLQTAKALSFKSHAWWTRPITLEEEEQTIRDMIEEFAGPPGSVSIAHAHKNNYKRKAVALMEAVDPRGHRYQHCFRNYFERYRKLTPFGGLHFFDWLDFGPGRRLLEANNTNRLKNMEDDEICGRERFDAITVRYFDDETRARHEVRFAPSGNGTELIARYRHDDGPVPPSDKYPHLYMLDLDEKFYVVEDTWNETTMLKHTSITAGRPAWCAGTAHFGENGTVREINFLSGHYRPGLKSATIAYQWMKDRGVNTTAVRWAGRMIWSTKDCGKKDWEKLKITGYNATALNSSCHEMTASPTWIQKKDE